MRKRGLDETSRAGSLLSERELVHEVGIDIARAHDGVDISSLVLWEGKAAEERERDVDPPGAGQLAPAHRLFDSLLEDLTLRVRVAVSLRARARAYVVHRGEVVERGDEVGADHVDCRDVRTRFAHPGTRHRRGDPRPCRNLPTVLDRGGV